MKKMGLYCAKCSKITTHEVTGSETYIPRGSIQPVIVHAKCQTCGNGGQFVTNGGKAAG